MAKTIVQKVVFKNISAATLYNTYIDAKEHFASTGDEVSIQPKEGTKFKAYGDYIWGTNLQLIKDKLIVQSWRAADWQKTDIDSTLILLFEQTGKDGIVHMTHANVPDEQYKNLQGGWNDFYWKPWKQYFALKNKK